MAVTAAVLSTALSCDARVIGFASKRTDVGGYAGTAGASSDAGDDAAPRPPGCVGECCPAEVECYGPDRDAASPGAECLATLDNAGQKRWTLRQNWHRSLAPFGFSEPYFVIQERSELFLPQCNQTGDSGFIQLLEFDLSDPLLDRHRLMLGYADYVKRDEARDTLSAGLCFAKVSYDDPANSLSPEELAITGAMPFPWAAGTTTFVRVPLDFEVANVTRPQLGEGIFYLDERNGRLHAYAPLIWVLSFDEPDQAIVLPMHEVEIRSQATDSSFNCLGGRYRADAMAEASQCLSFDPTNPPFGCDSPDGLCPDEQAHLTTGYFKLAELEMMHSPTFDGTMCVYAAGLERSQEAGWSNTTGPYTCRNAPNEWNPADPRSGLPRGDWCSATNSTATDDCHDAWRSISYAQFAAFRVKEEACAERSLP